MPDFGRWTSNGGDPSLNEINRTDRFLDALGVPAAGVLDRSQRGRARAAARRVARRGAHAAADGTRHTARRGGGADACSRIAQAHPHVDGPGGFGCRGSVVPRRFRRGSGRCRAGRPAVRLAHHAVRRGAADAHRSGGARLTAVGRGAAADRRGPVGCRAGQAADADDHRRDGQ